MLFIYYYYDVLTCKCNFNMNYNIMLTTTCAVLWVSLMYNDPLYFISFVLNLNLQM